MGTLSYPKHVEESTDIQARRRTARGDMQVWHTSQKQQPLTPILGLGWALDPASVQKAFDITKRGLDSPADRNVIK